MGIHPARSQDVSKRSLERQPTLAPAPNTMLRSVCIHEFHALLSFRCSRKGLAGRGWQQTARKYRKILSELCQPSDRVWGGIGEKRHKSCMNLRDWKILLLPKFKLSTPLSAVLHELSTTWQDASPSPVSNPSSLIYPFRELVLSDLTISDVNDRSEERSSFQASPRQCPSAPHCKFASICDLNFYIESVSSLTSW